MNAISNAISGARAVVAFIALARDLNKLEQVFAILDKLERSEGGRAIVDGFSNDARFKSVFESRPRLGKLDFEAMLRLPVGSLGHSFASDMRRRGLDPAAVQQRQDDGTHAGYVFAHLRETHDVWHTATGFDVDVAGELGLQAFYMTQFEARLSMVLLSIGLLNTALYATPDYKRRMDAITHGWQLGSQAQPFFGFDWAAHWAEPLVEVRRKLGLPSDPTAAGRKVTMAKSPLEQALNVPS